LPNINRTKAAGRAKMPFFVPCDLDLWSLTLTFKLFRARDQARLPYKFGANPFSGSRDISYTNKKPQTECAKNRTFRSSLRAVKILKAGSCRHIGLSAVGFEFAYQMQNYCTVVH